ncbi:MAG TPA: pilus assembly protein TadG-related protein [Solirubrobacteraceae bacterium]|jgi:Flp pilus assembly protein TadG|nr:pilus assembly protein TadG-related protein [Solirubrobacteraceae bacterium]
MSTVTDEQGAVMVVVALFSPIIVLMLIFVIDVSNWFEHQRHLQSQADSAALAAAAGFQPCVNSNIYNLAGQYGGAQTVITPSGTATTTGSLYNTQVGGTAPSNIHELVNSKKFYLQNSTSSPATPDDTVTSAPCTAQMVDVKMTETGLPWYFRALTSVANIDAQARVSILEETQAPIAEALAVADSAPVAAEAYFVDESNSDAILAKTPLTKIGQTAQGQDVWSNSGAPLPVQVNKPNVGVVIALSGSKTDTTCGDTYVQCFDQSATTGPSLLHVQGYSKAGTGTLAAPLARSVALSTPTGATCTDAYFSNSTTTCTEAISATIDYGSTNTTGVTVKPVVAGTTETALTKGTVSGTAITWTGTITLTQAGSNRIDLQVACAKGTGAACGTSSSTSATINDVQRPYAAGASSGPIAGAWISEVGGLTADADSYEVCEAQDGNSCTHNLIVTADVTGSLQATQHFSDPPYPIRIGTSNGNVVGCGANASPSGSQYRTNLGQGCTGPFQLNTSDPTCANATVSPFDCVVLASGIKNGPFGQGIDDRVVNAPPNGGHYYCPNNWVNNNGGAAPIIPSDDSRIITLFVMPYGSTDASGVPLLKSGYVPIADFATFYVTGWGQQGGQGDPCGTDDAAPTNAGNAWIVGHFITYVSTTGGAGSTSCVVNSLNQCVAQLTK